MYSPKQHSSHISFGFTIRNIRAVSYYSSKILHLSLHSAAELFVLPQIRLSPSKDFHTTTTTKKKEKKTTEGFNEHLCPIHRGYQDWQEERKTKDWIVNTKWLTSTVKGTAAERGWHSRSWLLRFGLHNNLIALHETLTNKLLKHLLGCHLHSFLISPEHKG